MKYQRLSRIKLPGNNTLRMCAKSVGFYGTLIGIGLFIFVWLRLSRLSKIKDLGETRFAELNDELSKLPLIEESSDVWRRPGVENTVILAAYLETRPEVLYEEDSSLLQEGSGWAMIRIIAIIPVNMEKSPLTCHYSYGNSEINEQTYVLKGESIGTRLAAYQENFGMYYCAAYILCELPGRVDNNIALPMKVTVTSDPSPVRLKEDQFVVVRYPKSGWSGPFREKEESKFAVCVQPLHHGFDAALDLVAFVEFYRMMGVDRFTFYRDSVDNRVSRILDYYAREGVATVIEWRLPKFYSYERNLRVDGIFAALNDCLYRSTFHDSYRYVAGVDVDEYIVPRKHDNFQQMMDHLNPSGNNDLNGAWIFRNVFFYLMHPDDPTTLRPGSPRLKLHTKTTRWRETNPPRDRSKFIVQGRDIMDLGNHHVWKLKRTWSVFGTRYKEVAVDPDIGGSHHYRKCETTVETCWQRATIIDRTAHRFTVELAEKVGNISRNLFPNSTGDDLTG